MTLNTAIYNIMRLITMIPSVDTHHNDIQHTLSITMLIITILDIKAKYVLLIVLA